jgi:3-oxoacyl-[acyl-carrier-protein] synthase III
VSAAGIVGMGLWVPDEVRGNDAWPASFVERFHAHHRELAERDFTHIERHAGARPYDELYVKHALPHDRDPFKGTTERRICPPDMKTSECDALAVRQALSDARIDPEEIDLVLSSALVPDRLAPANAASIAHLCGMSRAAGIGVEGFCSSAVAQLELAASMVETRRARFVVCVQSHILSRINDLESPMSPIFGDGSSAFVVGPVPEGRGLVHSLREGDGSLAGAVTYTYKRSPERAWWQGGDGPMVPGTDDTAAAKRLARLALHYPIEIIRELCRTAGMPMDALACVAMIQPLVWYQAAVAEGLGIPEERVPSTYRSYGHLGSAGIVANLLAARERGVLRDGAPVVVYAHGAGISCFGALLRWSAERRPQ